MQLNKKKGEDEKHGVVLLCTCGTQKAVPLLFACFTHVHNAQQAFIIGGENIPL